MIKLILGCSRGMHVRIDQARQHSFALQVEQFGLCFRQPEHLRIIADRDDALAADGHRFRNSKLSIDGHESRMMDNQVRSLRDCGVGTGRAQGKSAETAYWRKK